MSSESLRVLLEQNAGWLAEWAKDHAAGRAAGAPEINVPVAQLEAALTVIEAAKRLRSAVSGEWIVSAEQVWGTSPADFFAAVDAFDEQLHAFEAAP